MKVLGVRKHKTNENWRYVDLIDEANGKAINAFAAQGKEADALKHGDPLPPGVTIEEGAYGPRLNFPRPPGGGGRQIQASWRNTEEGFKYEQARMDKRTALMQSVQALAGNAKDVREYEDLAAVFYLWLRKE